VARVRLLSEACRELEAAASFYDSESPGLGRDFALEVQRLCRRIADAPMAGTEVRPSVRRRILRRFPYSILYAFERDEVIVIAVAHQHRRPGYWEQRVGV
jgi:plasmid stabilization system protein ParE